MNIYKKNDSEELEELKRKLIEINEIQTNILECVENQSYKLDSIEENMSTIDSNIEIGKNDLSIANRYFFGYKPIFIGAVLGACVLGPGATLLHLPSSGLISGLGGVFGGLAGYKIQKL